MPNIITSGGAAAVSALSWDTEESSTPVADNGGGVIAANAVTLGGSVYTLPLTHTFYKVTGIEWKNDTVINGNVIGIAAILDTVALPPTVDMIGVIAHTAPVAQTGVSAVQRANPVISYLIPGGSTIVGLIHTDSATARFRWLTGGASQKQTKLAIPFGDMVTGSSDNVAFANSTVRPYMKLYVQGITI